MPDCIFCNIAKGWAPATIHHQDDAFIAFEDIFPKATTHLLIVPRDHHEDLDAWLDAGSSNDAMFGFVAETAELAGVTGGYRLLTNVGRDAGQMIPHLHWHLMSGNIPVF